MLECSIHWQKQTARLTVGWKQSTFSEKEGGYRPLIDSDKVDGTFDAWNVTEFELFATNCARKTLYSVDYLSFFSVLILMMESSERRKEADAFKRATTTKNVYIKTQYLGTIWNQISLHVFHAFFCSFLGQKLPSVKLRAVSLREKKMLNLRICKSCVLNFQVASKKREALYVVINVVALTMWTHLCFIR